MLVSSHVNQPAAQKSHVFSFCFKFEFEESPACGDAVGHGAHRAFNLHVCGYIRSGLSLPIYCSISLSVFLSIPTTVLLYSP